MSRRFGFHSGEVHARKYAFSRNAKPDYGLDLGAVSSVTKAPIRITNDVCVLVGDGEPSDGSSGDGANVAGTGSLYSDYTNGTLYINTNTKASPTWTVVGTQS